MVRVLVSLALITAIPASADMSAYAPEHLCALLNDFGIETSPFQELGGGQRACYTTSHPGSVEGQSDFNFRVSEAQGARGLALQVSGRAGNFIGQLPQQLFLEMSEHLLSQFFEPHEVTDVLAALRELGPNERGSATGRGVRLRFHRIERVFDGAAFGVEFSLGLADVCSEALVSAGRRDCLDQPTALTWLARQEQME